MQNPREDPEIDSKTQCSEGDNVARIQENIEGGEMN